jgi:hypothetical protein
MFSRNPIPATLYVRPKGPNCLEYRVSIENPLPPDIAERLLRSRYRWAWESYLLRSQNRSRSSLPLHRALTELKAQSAESFLADVAEIFDDEHRFIVLIAYRPNGPLELRDELERFCAGRESRIVYVLVHVGDTACLYLHFAGEFADHKAAFFELFAVELNKSSPLPERPYRKLGIVKLENIEKLTSNMKERK